MKSDITFRTFKIGIRPTEALTPILKNENEILFPKNTFEAITSSFGEVSFSEALFAAKEYGYKIARYGWGEKGGYIIPVTMYDKPNSDRERPVLLYVDKSKNLENWLDSTSIWFPSQEDMFAEDWILLD